MCKLFRMLSRGADAQDQNADRSGSSLLDIQIRELRASLARSRQALAVAVETERLLQRQTLVNDAHRAELADRAFLSSGAGGKGLAFHEAEALAALEKDRVRLRAERLVLDDEMTRIRAAIGEAVRRQVALDQGSRVAELTEVWRRMSEAPDAVDRTAFDATSATLDDLCRLQVEADDAMTALAAPDHLRKRTERATRSGCSTGRATPGSERPAVGAAA